MPIEKENAKQEKLDSKKRKSYNLPEIKSTNSSKKKRVRVKLPTTTISFPNEDFRLAITETYKSLGYTTLKSYLLALINLSMKDENIKNKLKLY